MIDQGMIIFVSEFHFDLILSSKNCSNASLTLVINGTIRDILIPHTRSKCSTCDLLWYTLQHSFSLYLPRFTVHHMHYKYLFANRNTFRKNILRILKQNKTPEMAHFHNVPLSWDGNTDTLIKIVRLYGHNIRCCSGSCKCVNRENLWAWSCLICQL
jgi:hypothetical protein